MRRVRVVVEDAEWDDEDDDHFIEIPDRAQILAVTNKDGRIEVSWYLEP